MFDITIIDNNDAYGDRIVTDSAATIGYGGGEATIRVKDDESGSGLGTKDFFCFISTLLNRQQ